MCIRDRSTPRIRVFVVAINCPEEPARLPIAKRLHDVITNESLGLRAVLLALNDSAHRFFPGFRFWVFGVPCNRATAQGLFISVCNTSYR